MDSRSPRVALVLAGGAARGAYEVGVVKHLIEEVTRDLGHDIRLDILCGTSIGAINICALAAFADQPRARAQILVDHWTNLKIEDVVRPDPREIFAMARGLLGRAPVGRTARRGGLLDPSGLVRLLSKSIPFEKIDANLQAGLIRGVTVSTTHVGTGRTVVFVQRAEMELPPWSRDPTITPRPVKIRAVHALASAAIPFLFPAVQIDDEYYCDGGLRQNVPLSPARRLGADAVIVVNPRHIPRAQPIPVGDERANPSPGPLFLVGKTLNALLLDRIDNDIGRLANINAILEAGSRRYGPQFVDELNRELGHRPGQGIRAMRAVLIRASQDIGHLAADFVRSPGFRSRAHGLVGKIIRRLAEGENRREADLLSYLLFDGEFARQLIELGRSDARARHEELCAFFAARASAPAVA